MTPPTIAICICTFKRPRLLDDLLRTLEKQETQGLFEYRVVVVDNDKSESARATTDAFRSRTSIGITYVVESESGIARARNRALSALQPGELLAFLDDDEFVEPKWLLTLYTALQHYGCDGVLGPVKPHFHPDTPKWVIRGGFYDRPSYPTGTVITWRQGRTGNVLFRGGLLDGGKLQFNPAFVTGEDQDFFRRSIEQGQKYIWCHEAMAFELVPPIRWKRSFMLKRALMRGKISLRHKGAASREVAKSFVAVPAYLLVLPVALIAGHHHFMRYLINLFDHTGRLLALVGIDPVGEHYVTE
jgi:succinoglycan biosynthesis protein ExoM